MREDDLGVSLIDVQLVAQLCGGAGYAAWRDTVEREWRPPEHARDGRKLSTASWPRTL